MTVPIRSEIGPTMMIGRKLDTDTSMLSTPNTRPRTSSGRSSWSWVCAGIATQPYPTPATNAMNTTIASNEVTAERSSRPLAASAVWSNRLIGPAIESSTSMIPSVIRPPSMTRRRGRNLPYELSSRMPMTMPPPSGSTITAKSLGSRPSAVSAKSGPSTPSTPISEAVIPR